MPLITTVVGDLKSLLLFLFSLAQPPPMLAVCMHLMLRPPRRCLIAKP